MGWFGKKAPAPAKAPTRWTPELWSDVALGWTTHSDAAVVIRALKESGEWIYASRQMDHDVEYLGRLERLPGHPLGDVPVDVRFDNGTHPAGARHGDSQTLGMVYTGAYGDERTGFPLRASASGATPQEPQPSRPPSCGPWRAVRTGCASGYGRIGGRRRYRRPLRGSRRSSP